jgi:hypothetical protein
MSRQALLRTFSTLFINNGHRSAQVKGCKHKSDISTGMFYSFFSADEVKAPLSFYNALGMFYDCLPFFVGECNVDCLDFLK